MLQNPLQPVAILELKMWGGHCGTMEKVGGPTYMFILHGDFSLFWRLTCYDLPYQTQSKLMNTVEYEREFLFTRDTWMPL